VGRLLNSGSLFCWRILKFTHLYPNFNANITQKRLHPTDVGFLGAVAIAFDSQHFSDFLEQLALRHVHLPFSC